MCLPIGALAQSVLDEQLALRLARLPLKCIDQEYPNKTSHVDISDEDARLTPSQLHPSFYGCFDWHSSVHGHWMLVHLMRTQPDLPIRDSVLFALGASFDPLNLAKEVEYFHKYELGKIFERTYGWAWLLKLDEELYLASQESPLMKVWYDNLQPLTNTIVQLWEEYLPKQTYPNRTGVHPNSAFALAFALDWAQTVGRVDFEEKLKQKAINFYLDNTHTPAYLEPDGADFFSPSLQVADLMGKVLPQDEYLHWLEQFLEPRSIDNLCKPIIVSDRSDYQIGHLDGLMFSRAWNMRNISKRLPDGHPWKNRFERTADEFIQTALKHIDEGNYGGEHWLASFAIYALTR